MWHGRPRLGDSWIGVGAAERGVAHAPNTTLD